MPEPTILFCIGAPKAGTTWLYDYLAGHPEVHLRTVKELHYFDMLFGGDEDFFRTRREAQRDKLRADRAEATGARRRKVARKLEDLEERLALQPDEADAGYYAYLTKGRKRQKIVGDVTPCYAALGPEGFARMERLPGEKKYVFLLRDPVDRAWSAARMVGLRRAERFGMKDIDTIYRVFDRFLAAEPCEDDPRGDYAATLRALLEVVPRDRVHVEFYERLFTQDALDRLTAFLGIAPRAGDFGKVSNEGRRLDLDEDRRRRASDRLAPQYAFCDTFFEGRLPDRWRAHMVEV